MLEPRKKLPYQETYGFSGRKMNYRVLGQGQKIVLVHGSMTSDCWGKFGEELAKYYQVYLLDLPGFGASDTVDGRKHDTNLFTKALGEFLKKTKTLNSPVVAFSLGTVVAAKTAADGNLKGTMVLVGVPGKISGLMATVASCIPYQIRRLMAATKWGKENILIPTVRGNTGSQEKDTSNLLASLRVTDPVSLADPDYKKEIETEFPEILTKLHNPISYIYGEFDAQKGSNPMVTKFVTIKGAGHNVFAQRPKKTVEEIRKIIG